MTPKEMQKFLVGYPLPGGFEKKPLNSEAALVSAYQQAAFLMGAKGNLWSAWMTLKRRSTPDLRQIVDDLSEMELSYLCKWARCTRAVEFPAIFELYFARQHSFGDAPINDDTLYYLDLLLHCGRAADVRDFFKERYHHPSKKEYYWVRSRLVLALVAMNERQDAETERLALFRRMRKTDPGIIALDACIAIAQCDDKAFYLATMSVEKGFGDEGLESRIRKFLALEPLKSRPDSKDELTAIANMQTFLHGQAGTVDERLTQYEADFATEKKSGKKRNPPPFFEGLTMPFGPLLDTDNEAGTLSDGQPLGESQFGSLQERLRNLQAVMDKEMKNEIQEEDPELFADLQQLGDPLEAYKALFLSLDSNTLKQLGIEIPQDE